MPTNKKQLKKEEGGSVSGNSKAIKSGILVCYGAQCTCTFGSAKAKLQVTSHSKYFINDATSSDKLVATIEDTSFQPPAFGSCRAQRNNPPCVPALSGWEDYSMHIEAGEKNVLLHISKATCAQAKGAKNTIHIVEHGQEQVLATQNVDNATICPEINPLFTTALVNRLRQNVKPVGIAEISARRQPRQQASVPPPTAEAAAQGPALNEQPQAETTTNTEEVNVVVIKTEPKEIKSGETKQVEKVYTRPGQEVVFKVAKYGNKNPNPSEEEKQQVSWIVYKGQYKKEASKENTNDVLVIYENHGEVLKLSIEDEGIYTIEGSGGKMGDETCMLELDVVKNKPKDITPMTGSSLQPGVRDNTVQVPISQPIVFDAAYVMPPSADEILPLEWWLYDSAGTLSASNTGIKQLVHSFEHTGIYTLTLKYDGIQVATRKIQTAYNVVQAIELVDRPEPKLRPGSPFGVQVKKMLWGALADNWMPYEIAWYLHPPGSIITRAKRNGREEPLTEAQMDKLRQNYMGTTPAGRYLEVLGTRIPRSGEYLLEAVVKDNGTLDQRGSDTLKITVKPNEVKGISGPVNTIIKKATTFTITQFEFQNATAEEKKNIHWETAGLGETEIKYPNPSDKSTVQLYFNGFGTHIVRAWLNNVAHAVTFTIEVQVALINNGYWADDSDWQIRKISEGQMVQALIQHSGSLENEWVELKVYEQTSGKEVYKSTRRVPGKSLSSFRFRLDHEVMVKLYGIRNQDKHKLFFTITPEGFALNNAGTPWPTKTTDYLQISYKQELWNYKFVKGNKSAGAGTYRDGDIYFYCNSCNLTNKTVKVTLRSKEKGHPVQQPVNITVPDTGIIQVRLDYEQIKKLHKKENRDKFLNIYATVEEASIGMMLDTSKAATCLWYNLMPDYDRVNTGNTPVLVTADVGQNKKSQECECQKNQLIWGSLVSCEFRKKVLQICAELWGEANKLEMANNLMACIALETGKSFDPHDSNKNGYFGLIGFGDDGVKDIGTTRQNIMSISAEEQLNWVKKRFDFAQKYLLNNGKGGMLQDFTDLYLTIIYPSKAGLLSGEDAKEKIIFDASIDKVHMLEYRQNPSFMKEPGEFENKQDVTFKRRNENNRLVEISEKLRGYKDLDKAKTYRWEITQEIQSWYDRGKAYVKVENRTCGAISPTSKTINLEPGTWNVLITEKYTGLECTHEIHKAKRKNCRRGCINVYDHKNQIVLTINDCLLEGVKGTDHMETSADVPYGKYQIRNGKETPFNQSSDRIAYGPNPRLVFEPIKGEWDEADRSGRSAIRIHGGRQEDSDFKPLKSPELKRTEGCIRIYDADAKRFYDWWVEYNQKNTQIKAGLVIIEK